MRTIVGGGASISRGRSDAARAYHQRLGGGGGCTLGSGCCGCVGLGGIGGIGQEVGVVGVGTTGALSPPVTCSRSARTISMISMPGPIATRVPTITRNDSEGLGGACASRSSTEGDEDDY
jgi:hypothetical protein